MQYISNNDSYIKDLDIDLIHAGQHQPRKHFDAEKLQELAESIRNLGLIQPIVVRKDGNNTFEIIAGERRWRASIQAGLKTIPALILQRPPDSDPELALIENLQRQDLTPIEEAKALQKIISLKSCTLEAIASRLGLSRAHVSNTLRLLQLPESIQEDIDSGSLSFGHGKVLLQVSNRKDQEMLAELSKQKGLSVRRLEEMARSLNSEGRPNQPDDPHQLSPNLRYLSERFKGHLGTKVKISGDQEQGRIEITYYNSEDLDRICELVLRDE